MTIEVAFACVIGFAVALAQASRRSILSSGQLLGPVQILAATVCAALVPTLAAYTLHFHTAWALGIEPGTELEATLQLNGFALAMATTGALFVVGAITYTSSGLLLLAGRRAAGLLPALVAVGLLLTVLLRGDVGGRFSGGEDPPPTLIATAIVILFLAGAVLMASRFDADLEA